jgi:hypothetical protein
MIICCVNPRVGLWCKVKINCFECVCTHFEWMTQLHHIISNCWWYLYICSLIYCFKCFPYLVKILVKSTFFNLMHFRHFMTFMFNKLQCQDKHYVSDSKTTNIEFMFQTISCRYLSLMDLGNLNGSSNLLY